MSQTSPIRDVLSRLSTDPASYLGALPPELFEHVCRFTLPEVELNEYWQQAVELHRGVSRPPRNDPEAAQKVLKLLELGEKMLERCKANDIYGNPRVRTIVRVRVLTLASRADELAIRAGVDKTPAYSAITNRVVDIQNFGLSGKRNEHNDLETPLAKKERNRADDEMSRINGGF